MNLLPSTISQQYDPVEQMFVTDVEVADDVLRYSEKTIWTDDGPTGIYMALAHVVATTARVAQMHTEQKRPKK